MQISANLQYVQECLGELDFTNINSNDNKQLLSTIERFLNREYGSISKCVNIKIVDNKTSTLFGMTVAPTQKNLNDIMGAVLSGKQPSKSQLGIKVTEYIIELDSKLGTLALNLTDSEMTAILIHEIGHIVLNSKFIEDMNMIYIQEYSKKGIIPNTTSISDLSAMLYAYNYITKHQLVNEIKSLSVEREADKFVVDSGFGDALSSALSKFANYYSVSASMIHAKKNDSSNSDKEDAAMFIEYAKSFSTRQAYIKQIIAKEAKTAISSYWKSYLNNLIDKFTSARAYFLKKKIGKPEQVSESLITRLLGITPNITKKDIDELTVEVQMIETYEDKMYLIRKIHSKLDDIEQVLNMCAKNLTPDNKKKASVLTGYKMQLEKILNETIKRKIVEKRYEVFVKAPKGYEG